MFSTGLGTTEIDNSWSINCPAASNSQQKGGIFPWEHVLLLAVHFPSFCSGLHQERTGRGGDQPLGGSCALNQIQSHFSSWKTAALGDQGSLGRIQIRSRRRRQDGNRALPPWHLLSPIGTSQTQHQMEPVFSIPWQTVFSRELGQECLWCCATSHSF